MLPREEEALACQRPGGRARILRRKSVVPGLWPLSPERECRQGYRGVVPIDRWPQDENFLWKTCPRGWDSPSTPRVGPRPRAQDPLELVCRETTGAMDEVRFSRAQRPERRQKGEWPGDLPTHRPDNLRQSSWCPGRCQR